MYHTIITNAKRSEGKALPGKKPEFRFRMSDERLSGGNFDAETEATSCNPMVLSFGGIFYIFRLLTIQRRKFFI